MSVFVFLYFLVFLLFISLIIYKNEILCPPVVLHIVFIGCTLIMCTRWNDWDLDQFGWDSVFLLLSGIASYGVASAFVMFSDKNKTKVREMILERIDISGFYLVFSIVAGSIGLYLFYGYVLMIAKMYGYNSGAFTDAVAIFYYHNKGNTSGMAISFAVTVLSYYIIANATVALYVFTRNAVFHHLTSKDILLVVIVVIRLIYSFINSSRGDYLAFLAQLIYYIYFFTNIKTGWSKSNNRKIIRAAAIIFVAFLVVFVFLAVLMGRTKSINNYDLKDYLTIYIGGGIRNFDLFVKNPTISASPGYETFYSIKRFLANRFGIGRIVKVVLEFRSINGMNTGNIYTAFRRYYADFGVYGIVILSGILGFLYSKSQTKASPTDAAPRDFSREMLFMG